MPTTTQARAAIVQYIVDGVDNSLTPALLRQVLLDTMDSLTTSIANAVNAASPTFSYKWNTNTSSGDPGTGKIKGNNATLGSVTTLYMSEDSGEGSISGYLTTVLSPASSSSKSTMVLISPLNKQNYIVASITNHVDSGAYRTLTCTIDAVSGSFALDTTLLLQIIPAPNITSAVTSFNGRTGGINLTGSDVNTALGYTAGRGGATLIADGTNLNTIVAPGQYYGNSLTNSPTGGWCNYEVFGEGTGVWGTQLAFDWFNDRAYFRRVNNGTWQAWQELWNSGHQGTGSNLDADLLDGQHGSYYTNIPGRLGYSPVQQGTGTGQTNNAVKIGWSGAGRLKVTVDSTDLGYVVFDGDLPAPPTTGWALISSQTISSSVSGVTFSSGLSSYKELLVVSDVVPVGGAAGVMRVEVSTDGGSTKKNCSFQRASAGGSSETQAAYLDAVANAAGTGDRSFGFHVFNLGSDNQFARMQDGIAATGFRGMSQGVFNTGSASINWLRVFYSGGNIRGDAGTFHMYLYGRS